MVGFFDSGSGGLSVLAAYIQIAPHADVVYFGDIAHAPYGVRSAGDLSQLTRAGVEVLRAHGATQLVSACNSVSPAVLAGAAGDIPVIEMTEPMRAYMRQYLGKRFLLLATQATVDSRIYEPAVAGVVELDSLAVSDLASAVEFGADNKTIEGIIQKALETKRGEEYDGIILGCTHYPLVRPSIEKIANEILHVATIVDPAIPVAAEALKRFSSAGTGVLRFYISKESESFRARVTELFPTSTFSISVLSI